MLKITGYADRLLEDLNLLDWPESLKEMPEELDGGAWGKRWILRLIFPRTLTPALSRAYRERGKRI